MERQRPRHLGQLGLQSLRDFRLQRTSSWRSYRLCRRDSILRQGEWQVEETGDWFLRLELSTRSSLSKRPLPILLHAKTSFLFHIQQFLLFFSFLFLICLLSTQML